MEKFLWNDNHCHFPDNQFHCCISWTVPAGFFLSMFSILAFFVLGWTRRETSAENVKQNVLSLGKKGYCIEHDSKPANNYRKCFYVYENLFTKFECFMNCIKFRKLEISKCMSWSREKNAFFSLQTSLSTNMIREMSHM